MKKEARGIDDYDLGEVHDLDANTVVTKRELLIKTNSTYLKPEQFDSMGTRFGLMLPKMSQRHSRKISLAVQQSFFAS
jgi:hypothetical protein